MALYRVEPAADPVMGSTNRPDTGSCPRTLNRIEPVDMAQGLGCGPSARLVPVLAGSVHGGTSGSCTEVAYMASKRQGVLHRGGPNVIVQPLATHIAQNHALVHSQVSNL